MPLGRDNVGDEAIIACMVQIVREACPEAEITVSTDDQPGTAQKLGVRTVPLLGFIPPGYERAELTRAMKSTDWFIWSGATGLSDYPHVTLDLMETAQRLGKGTIVFATGMNTQLNPALYTLQPGRKASLLRCLSLLTLGSVDLVNYWNRRKDAALRDRIGRVLSGAELVVARDAESRQEVLKSAPQLAVTVGADPAIRLQPAAWDRIKLSPEVRNLLGDRHPKLGLCVSAQRPINDLAGLVRALDDLIARHQLRVLFIPMNPLTDAKLMGELQGQMTHADQSALLSGRYEPEEIAAVAGKMDVVASSRLHLLILAANAHVPLVGISRGSKVDNFLQPFMLRSVGETERMDLGLFKQEVGRLLDQSAAHRKHAEEVHRQARARLDAACAQLKLTLSGNARAGRGS